MPIEVVALKDVEIAGLKHNSGEQFLAEPDVARPFIKDGSLKVEGVAEETARDIGGSGVTKSSTSAGKASQTTDPPETDGRAHAEHDVGTHDS